MKMNMRSLPTQIRAGDVCIRATSWDALNVAHIQFPAGADAAPLLQGLPDDLCQCPHWGLVLKGSIIVRYADGAEERINTGEAYYWPPGHTVRVDEDYQAIEFSPAEEMTKVIAHLANKMGLPPPGVLAERSVTPEPEVRV